jgi:hypothetical protein
VPEVLRAPGQALSPRARSLFEPRFGHDFSQVRVHADEEAGASALSIGAAAYTVGSHVVFAPGHYSPGSSAGLALLAHELSHVVQQGNVAVGASLPIGPPDSAQEREADHAGAHALAGATVALSRSHHASPTVMRKLLVDNPSSKISDPDNQGLVQTNAATVEQYLRKLSPDGNPTVDQASGEAKMDDDFCPHGVLGGIGYGARKGAELGFDIGKYIFGVGIIPGVILGGLIGGIAGLFGFDSKAAQKSQTPTGSTCICDMINASNEWRIVINDAEGPATGTSSRIIQVPSPNSPHIYGAATASGQLLNAEPWLELGHEMCGHAWLKEKDIKEQPKPGAHDEAVGRENMIRREHGIEARGESLKDPYCGESFSRKPSDPNGPPEFTPVYDEKNRKALREAGASEAEINKTLLDNCQQSREEAFPVEAKKYKVSERIP